MGGGRHQPAGWGESHALIASCRWALEPPIATGLRRRLPARGTEHHDVRTLMDARKIDRCKHTISYLCDCIHPVPMLPLSQTSQKLIQFLDSMGAEPLLP
jgi:hypothetical protein